MRKKHSKPNDRLSGILAGAVRLAEEIFPEPGQGPKKKAWVVAFINSKVDIPGIGERMEERVLSILVDVVVALVINVAT